MLFMNEHEIDQAAARYATHPTLGPATQLLSDFRHVVNANSDGWSGWSGGPRAAKKLMQLIQDARTAAEPPTEAEVRRARSGLAACCTRHKWTCPELTFPSGAGPAGPQAPVGPDPNVCWAELVQLLNRAQPPTYQARWVAASALRKGLEQGREMPDAALAAGLQPQGLRRLLDLLEL